MRKKSTGSFYTPRDIVDYMVDSSLLEYLKTKTEIDENRLRALISYFKEDDEDVRFSKQEKKTIIDSLYTITTLDPACGSGAFPIGMLQKIVYILQVLDPEADLWFDKATENVGILLKKEFEKKFNAGSLNYIRKLSVIQNSIFGIDIQPIAVEISRLRCFLSLIIEEKVDDAEENRGVNALPNLDFKFIIANSLISLDNDGQMSLFEDVGHIEKLKAVRDEYFNAESDRRAELKLEFSQVQQDMLLNTIQNYSKQASKKYTQLFSWKPFSNEPTGWFDPDWMFGIKDGFDIVIANPPYIDSETMTKTMTETRRIYSSIYTVAKGNWDMFLLFVEFGLKMNRDDGICTMIVPNKLIAAEYARETRVFVSQYFLKCLRDYSNVSVFDNVAVYPVVFLIEKRHDVDEMTECIVMDTISSAKSNSKIDWKIMRAERNWDRFFNNSSLQNSVINLMINAKRLGDIATVRGAATVSEAYEIKKILKEMPEHGREYKRFINTGTIDRYATTWASAKTQYIKDGYCCPVVNINELDRLYPNRAYETNSEKIIIAGMTKQLECYYDNGDYLAGKSTTIIYNSSISLKYICAILNSRLMSWFYSVYFNSLSLAGGFFRIGSPQIKELPIVIADSNTISQIEDLVDKRIATKDDSYDNLIDEIIYKIYHLKPEEIELIKE